MPEYISRMLNSQGGWWRLNAAGQTRSGLNAISNRRVRELEVPVPTLDIQQRFTVLLQKYKALVDKMERCRREADDLFASLSQHAFRGEL